MYCNSMRPQVTDSKYAAYNVHSHIIKNKDLPDWISVLVQNRSTAPRVAIGSVILSRLVVEVQDSLDRG